MTKIALFRHKYTLSLNLILNSLIATFVHPKRDKRNERNDNQLAKLPHEMD